MSEQDPASPHRYLTDDFSVQHGDHVADIGVAEGNFGLSIIDKVDKLYLFENNPGWCEALETTFAPWKQKVEIINQEVSSQFVDNKITIDKYFGDKRVDFFRACPIFSDRPRNTN